MRRQRFLSGVVHFPVTDVFVWYFSCVCFLVQIKRLIIRGPLRLAYSVYSKCTLILKLKCFIHLPSLISCQSFKNAEKISIK